MVSAYDVANQISLGRSKSQKNEWNSTYKF